jgi:hypothetical protein
MPTRSPAASAERHSSGVANRRSLSEAGGARTPENGKVWLELHLWLMAYKLTGA